MKHLDMLIKKPMSCSIGSVPTIYECVWHQTRNLDNESTNEPMVKNIHLEEKKLLYYGPEQGWPDVVSSSVIKTATANIWLETVFKVKFFTTKTLT